MRTSSRNKLLIGLGCALLVFSIGGSLLFLTDDDPGEEVILNALGEEPPVYWSVKAATISTSSKNEERGSAVFRQRFKAAVAPREDLYVAAPDDESIGPFAVVNTRSAPPKEYTLHGVATSTSLGDRWSTQIALDNSVSGLGIPRSAFDGPVLIAGSARAARVRQELNAARELTEIVAGAAPVSN